MRSNLAEKFPELRRRHGQAGRPISAERFKSLANNTMQQIEDRIRARWPQTLDGETHAWGRQNVKDLMERIDEAMLQADELGRARATEDKVRDALAKWEERTLELFRRRAESLIELEGE